jgi:hypothetical protein
MIITQAITSITLIEQTRTRQGCFAQRRGRNWPAKAAKLSLNLMVTSSIVLGTASMPRVYGKYRSAAACHPRERNSLLSLVYWYNEYA